MNKKEINSLLQGWPDVSKAEAAQMLARNSSLVSHFAMFRCHAATEINLSKAEKIVMDEIAYARQFR